MGRSFLAVKLAIAFGLGIAVLVLVASRATASDGESAPAAVEQPAVVPAPVVAASVGRYLA